MAHTDQGSQYVSEDYTQQLDDAKVLASVGSVGDAYDNAMAESFVDSFKTELIKDRVWHSNTKLELAIVEWVAWFNTRRLHSSIGNRPPVEHEAEWRRLVSQPDTLSPPRTLFTLNAAREYDPLRGRLRSTVVDNRTDKIELLTDPTNSVSVEPRAFQGAAGCRRAWRGSGLRSVRR